MTQPTAPTPGQTIGPFFHVALPFEGGADLVPPSHPQRIRLHGRILDGAGEPVPDALVELWQTDPDGRVPQAAGSLRRDGWTFTGWGRAHTDRTGRYSFSTLPPGPARAGSAAFFCLCLLGRGLTDGLLTRAYLPHGDGTTRSLDGDALLSTIEPARRGTLLAQPDRDGYRFDIRLQGDQETVFLRHHPR